MYPMKRLALTPVWSVVVLPFLALQTPAQQTTGISHPDEPDATASADHYVKPSQSATPSATYQDSYPATASEPRLLQRDASKSGNLPAAAPTAPTIAQAAPYAPALTTRSEADAADGQIVLEVPGRAHELNRGTLLHARLRETLNTQTTLEGAVFTAELLSDVGHHGEIMLPAGSLIRGHVASIHGGKRITGGASMHLRPDTVSLPDGTLYHLVAQVTDLDSTQDLRVNDEGTIVLRSNPKAAAAVVGGVTGTAAVTGAVLGGGVGAAVGALAGAGIATAVYLKREVQENLPANTHVIFALDEPLLVLPR